MRGSVEKKIYNLDNHSLNEHSEFTSYVYFEMSVSIIYFFPPGQANIF